MLAGLRTNSTLLRQKYRLTPALPSMRCVGRQVWEVQDVAPRSCANAGIYATPVSSARSPVANTLKPDFRRFPSPELLSQVNARVGGFLGQHRKT